MLTIELIANIPTEGMASFHRSESARREGCDVCGGRRDSICIREGEGVWNERGV